MTGETVKVAHPAKFSDPVLYHIFDMLSAYTTAHVVLDPFAGIGKGVAVLRGEGYEAWGVEIEEEWAVQDQGVIVGDSRTLSTDNSPFPGGRHYFDAIVTSPCYGNRMADKHNARDNSKRHTYKHYLGRDLTEGSAAGMQWGREYQKLHRDVWRAVGPFVRPGGWFILNISDHIRKGKVQPVSAWHRNVLRGLGWELVEDRIVQTARQRHGENGAARVEGEHVMLFRKGE